MRPPGITKAIIEDIETAMTLGATMEIAAAYAGVIDRTLYNWQARGREIYERLEVSDAEAEEIMEAHRAAVAEAKKAGKPKPKKPSIRKPALESHERLYLQLFQTLSQAKAAGAVTHLNFLYKAAPHNPQVSMWVLERRFPEAFGPPSQRTELTGKDGAPVLIEDLSNLTVEERAARVQNLLALAAARRDETAVNDAAPE